MLTLSPLADPADDDRAWVGTHDDWPAFRQAESLKQFHREDSDMRHGPMSDPGDIGTSAALD